MPLDVLITTDRIGHDPIGREFIQSLQRDAQQLALGNGALYYDFPTYSDYETVAHKPDALLLSRTSGILAIRFVDAAMRPLSTAQDAGVDESLGQFCSILIGRLLKSRSLRRNLSTLSFSVTPLIYAPGGDRGAMDFEYSRDVYSLDGFHSLLQELRGEELGEKEFAEVRSVVEGAKALVRPQKRSVEDPKVQRHAVALAALEAEIANFDQRQRRAALISMPGPQRIRGLAGSGKTVILAMKAAHLHLTRPEQRILITFFTRSLRASITNLITRFYRHYRDEDPDWNQIHVRHGWGGSGNSGVYADACRREGRSPMPLKAAQAIPEGQKDPFDYVCRRLVEHGVKPHYDHVLIDEGQDFPGGFYELCFLLAKGDRDYKNIVWAYDELQNILNVTIRSPDQLFGRDRDGKARIDLERSVGLIPVGAENDTVLSKCYRNQREVLVTAHALGFGIYKDIVQLLENKDHWEDVGYEVVKNERFVVGENVVITRPSENNPISLNAVDSTKIIEYFVAPAFGDEVFWVVEGVKVFLEGGLQPEDIIIIALDDRNARGYFRAISASLAIQGIDTNNILADPYSEPPFLIAGKVTLSTVYRAKGNEAAAVFAIGVDGVNRHLRSGRNKLFTAFTRTKAWLRVSGVGQTARAICNEIDKALQNFPDLRFEMPDLKKVDLVQRDLSRRTVRAKKIRADFIKQMKSEGFTDDEINELLSLDVKDE